MLWNNIYNIDLQRGPRRETKSLFTVPVNGRRTKYSLHILVSRNHIKPIMLSYIVLFYNDKIVWGI